MYNQPLFILCGATGTGQSFVAGNLSKRKNSQLVVLCDGTMGVMFMPGFGGQMRQLWNNTCFDVMEQTGRSVLFWTETYPDVYCGISKERLAVMHFITLVCDEGVLRQRAREELGDRADEIVPNSVETWGEEKKLVDLAVIRDGCFRKQHTEHTFSNMILIDTTNLTVDEIADKVESYVNKQIEQCRKKIVT